MVRHIFTEKHKKELLSWFEFYGTFVLILLIIGGWIVFFHYISPEALVKKIGVENTYLVTFLLGVLCGFSSVTGTTFYVAVGTLAYGGANPLLLGIIGGMGLCISDFAFYYFISRGTHVIDKHWVKTSRFIKRFVTAMPRPVTYLFVFLYSAFVPIPNDIMLVTLAIGRTRFAKIAPFLFSGDIVSTIILAYLAQ